MVELTSEYTLFTEPKPSSFNSLLCAIRQSDSKPQCSTIKTVYTPTCLVLYADAIAFVGLCNGQVLCTRLNDSCEEKRFSAHKLSIHTMAIDCSSKHLITGGKDKTIKEWDFEGNLIGNYPSTNFKVTALCCANKYLLSGDTNGRFTAYDICTRKLFFSELCHKGKISAITVSARYIASGGYDTLIRLRALDTLNEIAVLSGHSKEIFNLCFTEDEKFLISVGGDSTVSVWSTVNKSISTVYSGHENWVRTCCVSPCGRYIIAGTFDNSVRFWDMESNDSEACGSFTAHEGTIVDICTSSNGRSLLTISKDKTLKIWSLYEESVKVSKLLGHREAVTDMVLSADCLTLYSSSFDMTICIWSLSNEKHILLGKMLGHEKGIRDLELGYNGLLLFSASEDGTVRAWDTVERKCICVLTSDEKMFFCVVSNTNLILAGGASGNITIWDLKTKEKLNTLVGHWNTVSHMALSRKKSLMYSCSYDKTIRIWDLISMKQLKQINAHGGPVKKISLSRSEKYLASASCDRKVKIWELNDTPVDTRMRGHNAYINSVLITKNEKYTYSGSRDGDLIVWSIFERVELFRFRNLGHINSIIEDPRTSSFIHSSNSKIFIRSLMFTERNFTVFPQKDSFLYVLFLKNLLKGKKVPFTKQWNDYIIFPWRVNILHIYAYLNKWQDIKRAMATGCNFLITDSGENPLSIALSRRAFRSADMILKYMAKFSAIKNPYIFHSIENLIMILPKYNLSNTHLLYTAAFPENYKKDLPMFGTVKKKAVILSKTMSIQHELLCNSNDDNGENIIFRQSLCKIGLNMGSEESIQLLFCLMNSEDAELFQTPLVQAVLKYKFCQIKKFLWIQAFLSISYLAILISYTLFNMYDLNHIFVLSIFNTGYLIYEALQVYQLSMTYFYDIWNVLDMLKISTLYICLALSLSQTSYEDLQAPFTYAIFFSMLRSIAVFRIFDKTRYMIRMILEVIKDISVFLLILLMATWAAGFSFYFSSESDIPFNQTLLNILLVNFGQFFLVEATWLEWSMFVFALFLNPLVLMNLLIAIMGDTFERVQYSMLTANSKEVASLVLEMEAGMLWKRKDNKRKYIQECIQRDSTDISSSAIWDGRMKIIRRNLKKLLDCSKNNQFKLDEILEYVRAAETSQPVIIQSKLSSDCARFKYKDLKNRIIT